MTPARVSVVDSHTGGEPTRVVVSGGPALNGHFNGQTLGACSDCRRFTAEFRAGTLDAETYRAVEDGIVRSIGHCMVMGTASTMASVVEALGLGFPYNAALPAVDSRRYALAHLVGRRHGAHRAATHSIDP